MAGVQKICLNNLNINFKNALIVGVIVARSTPKVFDSKKKHDEKRGVTSITIRDSDVDVINCDVWGSEYFANTVFQRFQTGDVVDIICPKICLKQGDKNERYRPQVSSPFYLSVNEGQSEITVHDGECYSAYLQLIHIPTKPDAGYYGLVDILNMENVSENEQFVDLLVIVRSVGATKVFKTKFDTSVSIRCIELMDNTSPACLTLQLFDEDFIKRSDNWQPLDVVLFLADVRVKWDAYQRGVRVHATSRTVITEQPRTPHAEALRVHARGVGTLAPARLGQALPHVDNVESIQSVMSVRQVLDRAASAKLPFTALVYAVVTQLDLDGCRPLASSMCSSCGLAVEADERRACACAADGRHTLALDLRVRISDHTGSLSNCQLAGPYAERVLGHTAEQIMAMDEDARGALKWTLLLERCAARVALACGPRPALLDLRRPQSLDNMPIY